MDDALLFFALAMIFILWGIYKIFDISFRGIPLLIFLAISGYLLYLPFRGLFAGY